MILSQQYFPLGKYYFNYRTYSFQYYFHVSNLIQTFKTDWVEASTQSSLFIQNSCSIDYTVSCNHSCTIVMPQLSSLTMIYFILGFKSLSLTFLVTMYFNCRLPSHQSISCILQFSIFLTKCILLVMCLVWLVSLPLLAIQTADLLSNIIRGDSSGTISVYLFYNSWINTLKCAKDIPAVHAAL